MSSLSQCRKLFSFQRLANLRHYVYFPNVDFLICNNPDFYSGEQLSGNWHRKSGNPLDRRRSGIHLSGVAWDGGRTRCDRYIWDSVLSGFLHSGKMHSGKRRRPNELPQDASVIPTRRGQISVSFEKNSWVNLQILIVVILKPKWRRPVFKKEFHSPITNCECCNFQIQ